MSLQMEMENSSSSKPFSPSNQQSEATPGQSKVFGKAVTGLDAMPDIEKLNEATFVDQITAHQERSCVPNFAL
jgi:hypothetical protein